MKLINYAHERKALGIPLKNIRIKYCELQGISFTKRLALNEEVPDVEYLGVKYSTG